MEHEMGFYEKYVKRLLDFLLSFLATIFLSPLLMVLTIIGTVAMKGNPFFVQKRPGKIDPRTGKEKIISLVKFRSMTNAKDKDGNLLPNEQRLTKYGRILRASSLDEVPSLLNILIGDLSICGPRPLLIKYLPLYTPAQRHRHDVRPGLTGLAQANGRNSLSWEEKFDLDIWYTQNISFMTDVKIIKDTVLSVIKREGINASDNVTMAEFKGSIK